MRLTCLVDNCVQAGSPLWGEHGLSFLVEGARGNVLWDTGQSGTVLLHNLRGLGLGEVPLAAVALSHAHLDHTGGLEALLKVRPGLRIHGHEDLFRARYSRREGKRRAIGMAPSRGELASRAVLQLSDAPEEIVAGVSTTGGIHHRPWTQGASPHHYVLRGDRMVPDPYADDMSLVLRVEGGVVLLCGCCHAGLRNTIAALRERYDAPLLAVVGGTHLLRAEQAELQAIADLLRSEGEPKLHLNHCTGQGALAWLGQAFGELVTPCPAGAVLEF